jgi:hypothetical protein
MQHDKLVRSALVGFDKSKESTLTLLQHKAFDVMKVWPYVPPTVSTHMCACSILWPRYNDSRCGSTADEGLRTKPIIEEAQYT